jgi:RNA polymerase sigma-70 factor (ECF subfamily)
MSGNYSFQSIFESHKNRVFGFAYRMLQDKESATDITQEVFFRLLKAQNSNKNLHNPVGWIFKTARNLCLDQIKINNRLPTITDDIELQAAAENPSLEEQLFLRRAVAALDTPMREALVLRVFQELSYEQIAEVLGTTKPAVRSLLYRARLSIKEKYDLKRNKR